MRPPNKAVTMIITLIVEE